MSKGGYIWIYFGFWWVIVQFLRGGGWWQIYFRFWLVASGDGWWWIYFGWWKVVMDGGGWWHSLTQYIVNQLLTFFSSFVNIYFKNSLALGFVLFYGFKNGQLRTFLGKAAPTFLNKFSKVLIKIDHYSALICLIALMIIRLKHHPQFEASFLHL